MIPIGRGQRELTSVTVRPVKPHWLSMPSSTSRFRYQMYLCRYRPESVHHFYVVRKLEEHGALANTIVVVATRLNPLHCNTWHRTLVAQWAILP